ncbi:hypothetical protein QE382_001519 [Sphingobacterium zeae]|uniref:Uncharacterized protein n=1 Tax=Sphingobacterium zeae TaxID=1776859 RepID=A0ABU0U3J3_9SPHI|nr:hypothetical protein [Sphingobacterium zeae]
MFKSHVNAFKRLIFETAHLLTDKKSDAFYMILILSI